MHMRFIYSFSIFLLLSVNVNIAEDLHAQVSTSGELKKWHRLTLSFEGPATDELADVNPFLNYRLDVTFTNGEEEFVVPGFYAADGNAAETSADSGNKWLVRFTPNKTGIWNYSVSFKKGENIAVSDDI